MNLILCNLYVQKINTVVEELDNFFFVKMNILCY